MVTPGVFNRELSSLPSLFLHVVRPSKKYFLFVSFLSLYLCSSSLKITYQERLRVMALRRLDNLPRCKP